MYRRDGMHIIRLRRLGVGKYVCKYLAPVCQRVKKIPKTRHDSIEDMNANTLQIYEPKPERIRLTIWPTPISQRWRTQ